MAKIEFSQGFMSGLPARILKAGYVVPVDVQNIGLLTSQYQTGGNCPYFTIFKGLKPTLSTFKTNYASLFANDSLINYIHDSYWGPVELSPTVVNNPINISSIYKASSKSGTAAWFCFYRRSNNATTVQGHAVLGDIGLIGSDADLELPDLNIVEGSLYRIGNFKIHLPSSWEY